MFTRMYVNLKLLLNVEFADSETMVKISEILESACATLCYLIQKPELLTGRMYLLQCFGNKFLLPLFYFLTI